MVPPVMASDRPALSTIPNVEILEVGTWATSTGIFTFSQDDLFAAVAAFDDPGYSRPVLKLGHIDPRFDGEPAIGRLINPRLSDDSMTLIVDLAGVPTWLADIAASAFPRRSIEGEFGHKTQTGSSHRFALTALSLLGVQAPAVSTLADIALLYGLDPIAVAASANHSLEESMPEPAVAGPVRVAASVNLDKVRQTFYSYDDESSKSLRAEIGGWPWVREVYNDFIIVDDDEGNLFQVPWSEDPAAIGEVVWGTPSKVRVEYTAVTEGDKVAAGVLRRGALRVRLAQMAHASDAPESLPAEAEPTAEVAPEAAPPVEPDRADDTPEDLPAAEPEPETDTTEDDMSDLSEIRSRLGLPDDADEAAILAALDAQLPQPTTDPDPAPEPVVEPVLEPVAASTGNAEYAAELSRVSAELAEIKAERQRAVKASVFDNAVRAGQIKPADRATWEARYDKAPDVITDVLASIAPGTAVPITAAGTTGTGDEMFDSGALTDAEKALFTTSAKG